MLLKTIGAYPTGRRLQKIQNSPNYKNNSFQNLVETPMRPADVSMTTLLKDFFFNRSKQANPSHPLPFIKTSLKRINNSEPTIVWFGHSGYLINIKGKNILVDPTFSGNASPFSFMIKAFDGSNEYAVADMPDIDLLLLTHDHYDHLDHKTVTELIPKVKQVYCSLGVGSHLEYWGYSEEIIKEFDWWDTHSFGDIQFTAAPARHFSGRGTKRGQSLWSSFILKTEDHSIYLGGDSGYEEHFKTIGEKYGSFDIAILECGQYNTMWPNIHMMPEQVVQASIDLKAKVLLPVHWAKFSLALHSWDEPIKRVVKKADELGVKITTPRIGEPVILNSPYPNAKWWQ